MSNRQIPHHANRLPTARREPHPRTAGLIGAAARWAEACATIVETLDAPTLPGNLARSLSALVRFDQSKIIVFNGETRPVMIHDSESHPHPLDGAKNYLDRSYRIHPFYRMYRTGACAGIHRLSDLHHFKLASIDYDAYRVRPVAGEEIGYLTDGLQGGHEELCIGLDLSNGRRALLALTRDRSGKGFSPLDTNLVSSMSPFLGSALRGYWSRRGQSSSMPSPTSALDVETIGSLSPREREIVQLIMQGHSSPSIALNLDILLTTVKTHRKNIYAKLRIASQCELFSRYHQSAIA